MHTTDLPVPDNSKESGRSARCSSRGHPVSLRVGTVEVSAEVSVNLHWWSRRSALQVGDLQRLRTSKVHDVSASVAVEHPEILAVREGIQCPCGSEQSKYRQRCQGVQVSDGLGGQRFKLAIARPRGAGTDL